ncbi:ATP-dependent helicase [Glycomyces sp. NPDC049804]|uniref:ATP-dependent helicase n=1 Tax=Glycomyces sp. NPDC049804 TaxID=3154363 RepID=UPI00343FC51C
MRLDLSDTAKAILAQDGPVLVVGGPGSGKTTLSLLKAKSLMPTLASGQEILFLSFSRAAVRQVEKRCSDILQSGERQRIAVRTYHAFALDILRSHGRLLTGKVPSLIYPGEESLARASFEGDWRAETARLATEEGIYVFSQFAAAASKIISGSSAVAELVADKYPIIIIDEFQDTDDDQWALVRRLACGSRIIFLADPDQRIFDYDDRANPERLNNLRGSLKPVEFDLAGVNHRSPNAGILRYADAVLNNQPLPETSDVVTASYWPSGFESTVHAGVHWTFSNLRNMGIKNPSIALLARTNFLVGRLSSILSQERTRNGQTLLPIDHDVLWDSERTAASALAIVSILEWTGKSKNDALAESFARIANYFETKNAANPSNSAKKSSGNYRLAERKARLGEPQRLKSTKYLASVFDSGITLLGEPTNDWSQACSILNNCSDLKEMLQSAGFIRLSRTTDEVGTCLASTWDRSGSYKGAMNLVRRTFDAGRILSDHQSPRGCVLMTIHKSKGKEFDGVILVEGRYRDTFFRENDDEAGIKAARRLLRVGITRARNRVVIIRPYGASKLVIDVPFSSQYS